MLVTNLKKKKKKGRKRRCGVRKKRLGKGWKSGVIQRATLVQFSLVAQSSPTLCDPMDCSTPGFPVYHQFPEHAQTRAHQVGDTIQPSYPTYVVPFSSCLQSFPASGSLPTSQFFTSGGQSIGVSASTSVLAMNTQD